MDYSLDLCPFTQPESVLSGGCRTAPEARALLLVLAVALRAERILETGYDAGWTTLFLASTGAEVVALDNLTEYPAVEGIARERLAGYENATLLNREALEYLRECDDASFDLIFIDDLHTREHVHDEAQEVRRVLRPGGIAAFHDTKKMGLWPVVDEVFRGWGRIDLPAIDPYSGGDYGLGLVRRPG